MKLGNKGVTMWELTRIVFFNYLLFNRYIICYYGVPYDLLSNKAGSKDKDGVVNSK